MIAATLLAPKADLMLTVALKADLMLTVALKADLMLTVALKADLLHQRHGAAAHMLGRAMIKLG